MNRKLFLLGAFTLLFVGSAMWSCQKDDMMSSNEDELMLKNGVIDCECVDVAVPVTQDVYGGGNPASKIGEIQIWNDRENLYISVGAFTYDKIKIVGFLDPNAEEPKNPVYNQNEITLTDGRVSYSIPEGWDFCTEKRFWVKIEGKEGGTKSYGLNYELQEICQNCEESFTYTAIFNEDKTEAEVTFTYIPEENMDAATLVFTFAQSAVVTGLEDWTPNGVTMQMVMDLEACTEYSWTVTLAADCNGKGQTTVNAWTDFKVGNEWVYDEEKETDVIMTYSQKGDLNNITVNCAAAN